MTSHTKPIEIVQQLRILYLEDDPTYAGFVQTTLEADGLPCEIELVDNREDFVASLEDGGYDIILADFVLPSIDGFSALSITQEKWPDIPFIIISAYVGEENAVECLKAGATDYVGKQQLSKLGPAIRRARKEIEERRKRTLAEESLLKNEQHYRILFDLSPSGILLEDLDGNIIDVNAAFCHFVGYSREDLVGNNVRILVPPESTADVAEHVSLILSRGTLEHDVTNIRKDGTLCHMELREKKIMLPDGKDGILVASNDVTMRKRAEEALRKSEADLRAIFEGSLQSFLTIDRDRRIRAFNSIANDRTKAVYGKNLQQGDSVYSVLRGEDASEFDRHFERALSGQHVMVEKEFIGIGNAVFWFEIYYEPITKEDGTIDGVFVTAVDITDRKQAEEALRESESRFRTIFEMAGAGIVGVAPDGKFLQVNPFFCRLLGYSNDELKELTVSDITHPDDLEETQLALSKTMDRRYDSISIEKRYVRKNGSIVWAHTMAGSIFDVDEKPIYCVAVILDITERKQTERALQEGEERYRIVAEQTGQLVYDYDIASGQIRWSGAALQVTGYTPEEFENINISLWESYIHPDDRTSAVLQLQEAMTAGMPYRVEYRFRRKDGAYIYIDDNGVFLKNENGKPYRMLGTMNDITERKRAEASLHESEEKFRNVAEQSPNMIFINKGGRVVYANKVCEEVMGYTTEEFYSSDFEFLRLIADESLDLIKTSFRKHMSGEDIPPYEYALKTNDGRRIDSIITTKLIKYEGETAILGIVTDITERKRAEESMQKLLRAVEQTDEVIFMTNTDGNITYVNPAFEKVYGFSKDEVIGKTPRILKSGMLPTEYYTHFWETILSGKNERGKHVNKAKDGRLVTVEASVSPIYSGEGTLTGFIAVQEDITDRQNAEAERKNLEAQLIQAQKIESLGTLAGGIAHDFNNILGIILGHSTLLEQSANDSAQQFRSTQAINKAVQRGSNLVGQILTFARKTDVAFEPVNLNEIITELARMLEDTFPKTIDISLELEKQIPYIEADRSQLHQTVLNLCVNARDAMPEGGTLSIRTGNVRIAELRHRLPEAVGSRFVRISVSDTGFGMDEATSHRIFEPFFSTKPQGKGTGLGLAVVFGIMKSHHGYMDVESKIGRGSSFHLYFPVAPRSAEMNQIQDDHKFEVEGGNETLLLVEDEEMLRELVRNILQAKGYKVITASDGEEAIRLYAERRNEIAVVISDIGLPKQSGGDVLSRLKKINPAVNVILASGYIEPEEKHRLLGSGATKFIQKPYVPEQILRQVREILDGA